jgi:MOSC domain-containing protein YiiM
VLLTAAGVEGDTICYTKHARAYAYAAEDLAFWARELGQDVQPGGVGENLTVSGVDCTGAVPGERWQVGEAVLQVRSARTPCRVFAGFRGVPDLVKRFIAAGRPGAYLAVVHPGPVRAGDAVTVLDRPAHGVTVADLMAASPVARERAIEVAVAREYMGARDQGRLDRTPPWWRAEKRYGDRGLQRGGFLGEGLEEFSQLRTFWGVCGAECLARAPFHTAAYTLDHGPPTTCEVNEHAPAVDGVGATVSELCRDQTVDDTGGRGSGQRGVRSDFAHAPAAAAGQHQQHTPAVAADTFRRGDRGQSGRYRAVQPVEQLDQTCHSRRRRVGAPRRHSTW